MAAGEDGDRRGKDRGAEGMYALVGELIEAYARMGSAITEYLVDAIGPPKGGKDALREAIGNGQARDRLLAQYGESLGLGIKYSHIGVLRKARNLLAHNIVHVGKEEVMTLREGHETRFGRGDLRRHVSDAREITMRLKSPGGGRGPAGLPSKGFNAAGPQGGAR